MWRCVPNFMAIGSREPYFRDWRHFWRHVIIDDVITSAKMSVWIWNVISELIWPMRMCVPNFMAIGSREPYFRDWRHFWRHVKIDDVITSAKMSVWIWNVISELIWPMRMCVPNFMAIGSREPYFRDWRHFWRHVKIDDVITSAKMSVWIWNFCADFVWPKWSCMTIFSLNGVSEPCFCDIRHLRYFWRHRQI